MSFLSPFILLYIYIYSNSSDKKRDISNHTKCNTGSRLEFTGSSVKNMDIQVKAQRVEHMENSNWNTPIKNYIKNIKKQIFRPKYNTNEAAFISASVCN